MHISEHLPMQVNPQWIRKYTRFKRNKLAVAGLGFTLVYFAIAVIGPHFAPYDPGATNAAIRLSPPSMDHPFGTDSFGRDVFSRVIFGARISLRVAILTVCMASFFGIIFGSLAGYVGSWVDEAISRFADIMFAFPTIILGLLVVGIIGPGLNEVTLALGLAYIPAMMRVARGNMLTERKKEYAIAAKVYAESHFNIMFREILPNMVSAVVVQSTIIYAFAILSEAGLSYLGLSAEPPTPTWGVMISMGQQYIISAPWISFFPGVAIMSTVLGLTFLGVGLRDALDPKTDVDTSGTGSV